MAMIQSRLYQRDILSINELDTDDIDQVLSFAAALKEKPQPNLIADRLVAHCFFEPSTRTRLSFIAATLRCGGRDLGFTEAKTTSHDKGESLTDTMRMMDGYTDLIVLRHSLEGAPRLAAEVTDVPVINAGDGANQHPTQTLLDLFSIQESQERLQEIRIAFVGDLKYGRTVHSLAQACSLFNMRLYLVSPEGLSMPEHVCDSLRKRGIKFSYHQQLQDIIEKVDIVYMTRLQRERLLATETHSAVSNWRITAQLLEQAKANLKILHPLPRVNEIDPQIDDTPYAYYFTQAKNALFVRQAILGLVLNQEVSYE